MFYVSIVLIYFTYFEKFLLYRCHADDDGGRDAEESHDEVLRGPAVCHTECYHEVKKNFICFVKKTKM